MSPDTSHKIKKVFIIGFLVILCISFLLSVIIFTTPIWSSHEANNSKGSSLSLPSYPNAYPLESANSPSFSSGLSTTDSSAGISETSIVERKLTQDGNLSLIVSNTENAIDSISLIATQEGGRVDSINYQNAEKSEKINATIIFRVPTANFSKAMSETKALSLKVVSESVATRDVTEQFVDMQARLKTLKVTEAQYQDIMQKAVKIDDVLNVSKYLADVRIQIEQIQGQMNYLSRQVDMSTITVMVSADPAINPSNVIWNPLTTANDAMKSFVETFYAIINFIIKILLYYLPLAILLSIIAVICFFFYRKVLKPLYEGGRDILHF